MRRARLLRTGWESDLAIESADDPAAPTGDQVLVAIEACGVCYRDCIDRAGRFPYLRLPITPGHEAVGRVLAVGPAVTDFRAGDRVATMHRGACGRCDSCKRGDPSTCLTDAAVLGLIIDGGYATHLLVPQSALYRSDDALPAAVAAVLHCTFGTAWRGMIRLGELEPGQRVLVTGANGGVGGAAVQLAARLGAHSIAVVRDGRHRAALLELGARDVLVDPGDGFHKRLPGGRVDLALECVGAPTFNAALRSLLPGGRLIVIGNVVDERAAINLGYLITGGLRILGSRGATRADMAELLALHARTPLRVEIDRELPLARADEAQRKVVAGGLFGRIVLRPDAAAEVA